MTAAIHTAGTMLQKRYRLDHPIATGGMAEVWQGTDRVLKREVAIKVLHPHLASDQDVVEHFRKEAVTAARLSHPNIVPTFDAGITENGMFVVQGLINGLSLAEVLNTRHFTPYEAAAFGRQIADALDHAHQHEVIHRDIKPENLLLVDKCRRVMIADFGIAKAVVETADSSRTMPGISLGTSAFCAPELAHGDPPTHLGDIYSLGLVLHEMVCGHLSATHVDEISVLHQQNNGYSADCTALSPAFAAVIRRATAKSPEDRYTSAGEMRDALVDCIKTLDPPKDDDTQINLVNNTAALQLPSTTAGTSDNSPTPNYVASAAQRQQIEQARRASDSLLKRSAITVGVLVLLAVATGTYLGSQIRKDKTVTPQFDRQTALIRPAAVHSFDPIGDRTENESQANAIIDGNPATTWSSETYASRSFGNLKTGVGVVVQLQNTETVSQIAIDSPSRNWAADLYISSASPSTMAQLGNPVGTLRGTQPGITTIKVPQVSGNTILVWFTDLGDQNRVSVAEITASR